MKTKEPTLTGHRVVPREQWLKERIALLAEEKAFTRQRDEMGEKVRGLPWVKVDKTYTFDSPTPPGKKSLADLFGPHSQLIVYHLMFDPTWSQPCKSCSFIADHYNPLIIHFAHRDTSFMTVSKAPVERLEAVKKRLGWTFPWVSAANTDFGHDFGVSFSDQQLADPKSVYNYTDKVHPIRELPGLSVFYKDPKGAIYHTYSTYSRGLDIFLGLYNYLDVTPKGRDEAGTGGMDWVRHHDRYNDPNPFVHPWMERPGITGPVLK